MVALRFRFYFYFTQYHLTNVLTQAEEKSPIFLLHSIQMEVELITAHFKIWVSELFIGPVV